MINVEAVCNELIRRSLYENIELSPLKLQKLIYLIHAYGLSEEKKLFDIKFNAWKYGPVCDQIYQEFKSFKDKSITSYAQDAKGISYFPNWEYNGNSFLLSCVNKIWNKYKNFSGGDLISLTHQNGSAWSKTLSNCPIKESDIKDDVLRGLY